MGRLVRPSGMKQSWRPLLILVLGVATSGIVATAGVRPVWASCAVGPSQSPYWFTGTVVSTTNADRTATVRTDDGRIVIVRGTEADGPDMHTTVDRSYRVGLRYEFDPINASSPYQDNICSATHPVDASAIAVPAVGGSDRSQSGSGRIAFWAMGGLVVALGLWIVDRLMRRARKRAT
jgi:hypothetical protein